MDTISLYNKEMLYMEVYILDEMEKQGVQSMTIDGQTVRFTYFIHLGGLLGVPTVAEIADAVLAGHIPDPTTGATHFLNPVIVRERRGGSLPSWADSDGQPIGRHVFYCPECKETRPTRAAVDGSLEWDVALRLKIE